MQTRPASRTPGHPSSLGYLPGLDGLRAVSVLAVIAFHHYFIGGHEQGFAPGGFLGVEVFFVISGYLITALLLAERRRTGGVSLRRFWIRRARRLIPALLLMLSVVILWALLFLPDAIGTLKSGTIAALTYTSNWWQIISHQSYASEAGRPALLKHLWSLAIEEQFYLLWPPLLVLGLRKLSRRTLLGTMTGVALASTLLMAVIANSSIDHAYYSTITRLSGLLLGSAMAFFFAPYQIRGVPGRGARLALDGAGLAGMAVLVWAFHHYTFPITQRGNLSVFRGGFLLVDLATLLVIAAVVHPRSDAGPILGWLPLRWIGLRSYGLYLWHYPIFCITRPGLDVPLHGWPLLVLRLALSFGAAEVSYRYVETPIRNGAIARYLVRLRSEHGERRERIARRGLVIVSITTVVFVSLGGALASAQGEAPTIPGFDQKAHADDVGNAADPGVIAALRKHNASTTTQRGTPTTRKGATPTSTKTGVTVAPNALAHEVLAVGDSVMLGAEQSLEREIPGIFVDAMVSRQFWDATVVFQAYKNAGLLPPTVVVHMGTNGAFSDEQFAQMMEVLGSQKVFFLNAREPRSWETEVNQRLKAAVKRYPNAHLLNWHDYSTANADWFVSDGIHLTGAGAIGYADFIRAHLEAGK